MEQRLQAAIRNIPDFPKPGIQFKDITPIFLDPELFRDLVKRFAQEYKKYSPDAIVGIESRGYLAGPAIALELGIPFVLIRKKGKLPAKTISHTYSLEYGTDVVEVHEDAIAPGSKVIVHDDLLATGGTAEAAGHLVEKCGSTPVLFSFIVELNFLNGKERLEKVAPCHSIITY
ncbi:adenine phosphoribosyltransferase [Luteibaculum oceani]|uniref:Adenine phosphoribosyltransferase n=1 Tax=Luteibaculum oceani TaxID=1294296 RepID=A0A5C6VAQ3_9FLAO|nr:adenine phosphoribosyltransferase [Luteibaculum oceani]TXC81631.1 adenine phosphoribosyltransferase [Luteibaculum oceani]